ncbi:uridine kinase [Marinomonas sp. IMCC 4694]|uniref:uridine kinase n=1 Tax=Marinomonas sp. IMCC 4694 TaxID=2605432 RepID=UPI0021CCED69|nr:uridine kinase [Marinomonas sp. IMCC 4694]
MITIVKAETLRKPHSYHAAELFGLPLNNLMLSSLEKQMTDMGMSHYPSYKEGITNYSLGNEGILGVTNAEIYSSKAGYVREALLSGVVQSMEKRRAVGKLLEGKYGTPTQGHLNEGIGRSTWRFTDGTVIELQNTTYYVSIKYANQPPEVVKNKPHSGRIDVQALAKKTGRISPL